MKDVYMKESCNCCWEVEKLVEDLVYKVTMEVVAVLDGYSAWSQKQEFAKNSETNRFRPTFLDIGPPTYLLGVGGNLTKAVPALQDVWMGNANLKCRHW